MRRPDPVRLEVFHHLLAAICEESGALLQRSAISPNIRERRDFSCALFDGEARLIAQAAHIPVHLGSAGDSVRAVLGAFELEPGDVVLLNDPYRGGTHLPDLTMVLPVFCGRGGQPAFFLVNRAHHADIGGAVGGSMGVADDLHGEGLVIPPVKLRARGVPVRDVLALFAANVRGAGERTIDLEAQRAALELGAARLRRLVEDHGLATVSAYASHAMDYSARIARATLAAIPRGRYTARDVIEDDGRGGGPFELRLTLTIGAGHARFDYRGSAGQARGGINANRSIVTAASLYAIRALCPGRLPTNEGLFSVIEVLTDPGSLLDPSPPAPVAGGNVETSQRLVDVALAALARAVPERIPACSAGTMSNLTFAGREPRAFTTYETLPGGAGASAARAGTSAVQTHMTNTRNTSIEEFERQHPLRIGALTVRRGSGGGGARRGGDGLVKEIEALAPVTAALFSDRAEHGPPGARGGARGKAGRARVRRATEGRWRRVASKATLELEPGDRLRIETPGGGGHGRR